MFFISGAVELEEKISSYKMPVVTDKMMLKIANGDMDTYSDLYQEASQAVYGYALSILKNRTSAEDVMQDTFIKVYANASSYRPEKKPMAWILTITRNLCLMNFRKKTEVNTQDKTLYLIEKTESDDIEDKMLVKQLLQILSETEREIVMLHALSGLKHREIASLIDLPLSTVLSKYNRSIVKLRKYLKEASV